jgi:hypothetical protein
MYAFLWKRFVLYLLSSVWVFCAVETGAAHGQSRRPTNEDVDIAIRVCTLGTRTDASLEGGLNLLKRRILTGEGSFSYSEIPSVIGTGVQGDEAKIRIFDQMQKCVVARVYGYVPRRDLEEGMPRGRVAGWLVTFGTREHGGGSFRDFGASTALVSTEAALDVRSKLPRDLSPRNVYVDMTAATDHRVTEPGVWVYFMKIIGAPQSYTQCMHFEILSEGVPIGGGPMPILRGQSSNFETSAKTSHSAGFHPLMIKLGCYFQGGEFPVAAIQLKTPSGEWQRPMGGDFSVLKPINPDRPPEER